MFNNTVLDVCIGLIFIFLIYSLLVTIVAEMISTWLGIRARILRVAIERMLNDGYYVKIEKKKNKWMQGWLRHFFLYEPEEFIHSFAGKFYEYPSIKYLGRIEQTYKNLFQISKPSYFSADNFAETIINMLKDKGAGDTEMKRVHFCLRFNTNDIQAKTLSQFRNTYNGSDNDLFIYKQNLMKWFNETMDRASGWYKRKIQVILFILGIMVAIFFNVDTITIATLLSKDKTARAQLVQMGIQASDPTSPIAKAIQNSKDESIQHDTIWAESFRQLLKTEKEANSVLGLGWSDQVPENLHILSWQFPLYKQANPFRTEFWGLVLTALAISLGSPFWFDLLRKLVSIRGSGVKPEEKKDEGTKALPVDVALKDVHVPPVRFEEPVSDLVDHAMKTFGLQIKSLPGVKSVFTVIQNKIKTLQVNVDSKDTEKLVLHRYPSLKIDNFDVPWKIVVSGTPLSHQAHKGIISNKSGNNGFGTLGCALKRKDTGSIHILSCWHVMKADINYSVPDDQVLIADFNQMDYAERWAGGIQGAYDYGIARCVEGQLENYNDFLKQQLQITGELKTRLITRKDIENQISVRYFDSLNNTVKKGFIYSSCDEIDINYLDKTRIVNDVLILTDENEKSLSREGNSGSVLFDENNFAIAMIVSGDLNYSYAVKLSHVFRIHNEMMLA